jgi:succinoglycan biosynthesis transport protein ExoP
MLQFGQSSSSLRGAESANVASERPSETLQVALGFLSRRYREIGIAVGIAVTLGVIYLLTATPSYTATASMLIDSNKMHLFQQQSAFSDLPMDASAVESQVEVLKSENIALAVIKQLHLTEDPEFVGARAGLIGTLINFLTAPFVSETPDSESQFELTRQAVNSFQNRLNIRRVGLTYVIEIGFRSYSADRAAQIANAVADAYVDDQLEAKYQAAKRAGVWLQARLRELREQASAAQLAVVNYKNKNDMVDAGGRTINEQQLAELNSELVAAQSQTAEARAKADRVQSILVSGTPDAAVDATVTDTLKDDVITKLRSQYLELSRRLADWTVKYGAEHLAVVNVRNQMSEIQNSVRAELQRIAETYKSDLEVARQREDSIKQQLNQAVSLSQVNNQAQVSLRELQTNAESYQALYDNFLQRYMESVQQQSFPISDARVISAATRPLFKSDPKSKLTLGVAVMLGLAFGVMVGAWREFVDRVFRTSNQVETLLQTDCIALVPALIPEGAEASPISWRDHIIRFTRDFVSKIAPAYLMEGGRERVTEALKRNRVNQALSRIALEADRNANQRPQIPDGRPIKRPIGDSRRIVPPTGVYSTITDSPLSGFTESIRSIKIAVDLSSNRDGGQIIGFTSSVPNEGKSSIAGAVARLTALTGAKTLLVDCDLRNPSLSRLLAPEATRGLLEVVRGESSLTQAVWVDPVGSLNFLPVAAPELLSRRLVHSSEVLASDQTREFFNGLRQSFDYIFMDFAPLMPIVDVRASTKLVDAYIYVIEWGRTRTDHVEEALRSAKGVYEQLLGVVLNKVDLASIGRYDGRGSGYYRSGNYHRYGYTE